MKRALYIASGLSVLVTTLTYGHNMYRIMEHLVAHHGQGLSHPFSLCTQFSRLPLVFFR